MHESKTPFDFECLSIGFDETCELKFPDGTIVKATSDELTDLYLRLDKILYTMGFKSGCTPEKFNEIVAKMKEIGLFKEDKEGNLSYPVPMLGKDEEIPDYYCQECGMPPHNCLCSHDD